MNNCRQTQYDMQSHYNYQLIRLYFKLHSLIYSEEFSLKENEVRTTVGQIDRQLNNWHFSLMSRSNLTTLYFTESCIKEILKLLILFLFKIFLFSSYFTLLKFLFLSFFHLHGLVIQFSSVFLCDHTGYFPFYVCINTL